ncbi:hypothetical protein [Saccharothrix xinjiangensis]|uniref:WXG100 family type VII secretion target n=1 Tax=Saccharothrix xinjiangensis TaxID=204798 RepID=A0ABV9Y158_9PSEU
MTLSYHDVRRWDADAIETTARSIRTRKDRLIGLEDELDRSFGPLLWHGDSATAARGELRAIRDRAEHLVAEASAVQRALHEASDAVADLSRLVHETESTAGAHHFAIGADGSIADASPQVAPDPQRARLADELAHAVSRILVAAEEIDRALAHTMAKAEAAGVPDQGATSLAGADVGRRTADGRYRIGAPDRPDFRFDEDFAHGSADPTPGDHLAKAQWLATLRGAQLIGDMPDATQMYEHYWKNTGEPREFDYEKAYREDPHVRAGADGEITRAALAAEELIRAGNTEFPMTGEATAAKPYPATENWQKAIGDHQVWSHGNVRVNGNTVTMEIVVEAEDRYNFNRDDEDVRTGLPDNGNGRFTEVGWAKPFDAHGTITRTVTWELGHPPTGAPGEEIDARGAERDRGPTPDNPRERRR